MSYDCGYDEGYNAADDVAASEIYKLKLRIEQLEADNFALAANQCFPGRIGDEYGNSFCPALKQLEAEINRLNSEIRAAKQIMVREGIIKPFTEDE